MRHEQALPTQQLANPTTAGTSAFVDVAFHSARKRRQRNRPYQFGCVEVL